MQSSGSGKTTCMKLLPRSNNFIVEYILLQSGTDLAPKFEDMIEQARNMVVESSAKALISKFFEETFEFKTNATTSKIFVLCIDEASWLCNKKAKYRGKEKRTAFELLRKTLYEFCNKERRLVIVLADTVSVAGNFVPPKSQFNTHMKTNVRAPNLFPVIYRIPFFDVFV